VIKDEGMGKLARLTSPDFSVVIIYNRGPVSCDIETKCGVVELIQFANFLNNKKRIYEVPMFYWERGDSNNSYIRFFDHVLENEFNKITDFISNAGKTEFEEAIRFQHSEWKRLRVGNIS